jgi:hypothetical protein
VSTEDAYRAAEARAWAGAASVDVTPPRGIAMAGWSNQRHEVSTGTHGTLRTSALVLGSEDGPRTALLVLEVCVLTNPEAAELRRRVGEALRLPPRAVRVSATHAHSCPALNEICGSWLRAGRDVLEAYRAELLERSVRCAVEAAGRLRPTRARHARGESSVPVYRRVVSAGRVRVGLDRQAPVRRSLDAVRLDDADGRRIATIAALGAHPTVLAGGNDTVSAEFPGVARRIVEDVSGAPCLYLQGAAADVGPRRSFTDRVEDVESLGREIGHHVLALVEQAGDEVDVAAGEPDVDASWLVLPAARPTGAFVPDDLAVLSRDTVLPVRADLGDPADLVRAAAAAEADLYEARERPADAAAIRERTIAAKRAAMAVDRARGSGGTGAVTVELHTIRVGPVALVGVPAELFWRTAEAVEVASPAPVTILSGYSNGYLQYLPRRDDYEVGGYEVEMTPFLPGAAERLERAVVEVLSEVAGGVRAQEVSHAP